MSPSHDFNQNDLQKTDPFLLIHPQPFAVQEAFRALRTNVMFALPGSNCKFIGITSAAPGDGKSTTASNLAISLAQIGKKVLLIDCDMRLPTIAAKFSIRPEPGLSDLLVGQAMLNQVLCTLEEPALHILPAGRIPPDPTGLLESPQLDELFYQLRSVYEYVIVDLPPVATVTDALILSKCIDGYLLVVREGQTGHRAVKEMMKLLEIASAKVIGFVLSGMKVDKSHYYKYDYSGKSSHKTQKKNRGRK